MLTPVELRFLDAWFAARPARTADPHIALVAFEQPEVEAHRETRPNDCTCRSVPRNYIAEIIQAVRRGGARVVVLDLTLEQTCQYRQDGVSAHDGPLVEALRAGGETVLAAPASENTKVPHFLKPRGELAGPANYQHILGSPLLYAPGGVVRAVSLVQTGDPKSLSQPEIEKLEVIGKTLPPLSAAAWAAWSGRGHEIPVPCGDEVVECMDKRIPTWPSASIYVMKRLMPPPDENRYAMLINWVGPVGTFPMYRAATTVKAAGEGDDERLRSWFEDRVVIVGSAVERLNTPQLGRGPSVPISQVDQSGEVSMTGLEIHANALQTLLHGSYIRPTSSGITATVVLLSSLLAAFGFRYLRGYAAVGLIAVELAALLIAAMLLMRIDLWLYVALPATALLASGASTAVWGYAQSLQRADELAEVVAEREAATATIVHDLKQPLSAISTMAQVLRHRSESGKEEIDPELANRMLRQVESALADIDDLLIASPERALPLHLQRFDLARLARDLAEAQSYKSNRHDVEVVTDSGGVTVAGDPRYLGRVLSNLVDNAIKYWPDGGTVRVEVEEMSGHAIIRVVDEGIGMTDEQQKHCFERYRRVLPEELSIPGTGIGLYSVQRIVEAHGGRVQVVSAPGVGSTFVVMLPLHQPDEQYTAEVHVP